MTFFYGERNPNDLKVVNMAKESSVHKHFHTINYTSIDLDGDLHPLRYFNFGTLTKIEWFKDVGLLDKVINVDVVYNYNALGFATDRTVTRTWYYEDGTACTDIKVTNKRYDINPQDQLDEAIRRRTNNVRQTDLWLIGAVPSLTSLDPNIPVYTQLEIKDDGVAFFKKYQSEEALYIGTGSNDLEIAVRDETDSQWEWFDTDATIIGITGVSDVRDYIIYQLSDGLRNKNGAI